MIDYSKTKVGDILRIVGAGAPGFAPNGALVRVTAVRKLAVGVENTDGESAEFAFDCGAARLAPTEFSDANLPMAPHAPVLSVDLGVRHDSPEVLPAVGGQMLATRMSPYGNDVTAVLTPGVAVAGAEELD